MSEKKYPSSPSVLIGDIITTISTALITFAFMNDYHAKEFNSSTVICAIIVLFCNTYIAYRIDKKRARTESQLDRRTEQLEAVIKAQREKEGGYE